MFRKKHRTETLSPRFLSTLQKQHQETNSRQLICVNDFAKKTGQLTQRISPERRIDLRVPYMVETLSRAGLKSQGHKRLMTE